MLIQKPHPNQKYLIPHEYPIWLIISVALILIIWGEVMRQLPAALNLVQDRQQMQGKVKRADSLYKFQQYKEAITIYKQQYLKDTGVKPIKLAICYLHLGNNEGLFTALALLGLSEVSISEQDKDVEELFSVMPQTYTIYMKPITIRVLSANVTSYLFEIEKFKKERPEDYQKIVSNSKEFEERFKK